MMLARDDLPLRNVGSTPPLRWGVNFPQLHVRERSVVECSKSYLFTANQ